MQKLACEGVRVAWPSVDWLLQVGLMQGGCTSGGAIPGQPPGHIRHAVAIGPGVVEDSQNGRELLKLEDCNDRERTG